MNVTDHDLTLRSLTEVLQNNVTPYVVSLQAKDCPGKYKCSNSLDKMLQIFPSFSVSRFHYPFLFVGTRGTALLAG